MTEGLACDFCGRNGIDVGQDRSMTFYIDNEPRVWCTSCREGSKVYHNNVDSPTLFDMVDMAEYALERDPIRLEEPFDLDEIHEKKLWLQASIILAKQEVVFRLEEILDTE